MGRTAERDACCSISDLSSRLNDSTSYGWWLDSTMMQDGTKLTSEHPYRILSLSPKINVILVSSTQINAMLFSVVAPGMSLVEKQWLVHALPKKRIIPDGQKPSGIIGLPIGMKFRTANRRECADRTPVSGKTTFPDGWPTGKFSWRELLTIYGRAGLVEYLTATYQELWFWPSGNQLWAVKKLHVRNYIHQIQFVCKFHIHVHHIHISDCHPASYWIRMNKWLQDI